MLSCFLGLYFMNAVRIFAGWQCWVYWLLNVVLIQKSAAQAEREGNLLRWRCVEGAFIARLFTVNLHLGSCNISPSSADLLWYGIFNGKSDGNMNKKKGDWIKSARLYIQGIYFEKRGEKRWGERERKKFLKFQFGNSQRNLSFVHLWPHQGKHHFGLMKS